MEEEKIIQGPQKLHTESPVEIEDMLTKKVGGNFVDANGLDTRTIKSSEEIEQEFVALQEQEGVLLEEINSFGLLHPELSEEQVESQKTALFDQINTLDKQMKSISQDYTSTQLREMIDVKSEFAFKSKGGVEATKKLDLVLKKTLESLSQQMSTDYKKLEKYQEDLDQTQEDITRLRGGVDVDFTSRGMTEKLSIEEKINLLNTDFDILSERIPLLEKKLHENQIRMNALVNIINPEAKTS